MVLIPISNVNRRTYLMATGTVFGAVSLSGCSSIPGMGGPKYEDVSAEETIPPVSVFPSGWSRNDEYNENFEAAFLNEDETIFVFFEALMHDTVDAAKESYQSTIEGFREPQEMSIGDEAFWDTQNDETASTFFRDSNFLGGTTSARQSGMELVPDQSRSQKYAREMYEHLQDL